MNTLKIKKLHPDATIPTRAHETDAGLDIYANETVTLKAQEKHLLSTGIAVDIPPGYVGLLTSRSGVSSKTNLVIETGKIDSGYNGEMLVNIKNDIQSNLMNDPYRKDSLYHKVLNTRGEEIYSEHPLRGEGNYLIKAGDKIAQLVIQKVELPTVSIVDEFDGVSERGANGFGSTDR